jgi:transposase
VTVTLPKPMTSGWKADGRFDKQDFVYLPDEDAYRWPAGEKLKYDYGNVERGLTLRRSWTTACHTCSLKSRCITAKDYRIVHWEHEETLDAVQRRLDLNPGAMRQRREVVEHPFGTIKLGLPAIRVPARPVTLVSTQGAGDVFVGRFVASWAKGQGFSHCIEIANDAAAVHVTAQGEM